MPGRFQMTTATWTCAATSLVRSILPTVVYTPIVRIAGCPNNGSTVYLTSGAATTPGSRFKNGFPIRPGKEFTFSGVPLGNGGFYDLAVGSALIRASAAVNQRLIITYAKQD